MYSNNLIAYLLEQESLMKFKERKIKLEYARKCFFQNWDKSFLKLSSLLYIHLMTNCVWHSINKGLRIKIVYLSLTFKCIEKVKVH